MDEPVVTSLEDSISPLRASFNDATGKPRFISLVSPTCGPCLHGATAVREEIVDAFHEAGFPVSLVWIPMLAGDSQATIEQTAAEFSREGLRQFADTEWTLGRLVADSLGGSGSIAWDIYLFYGPDVRWTDELPPPTEWVHQLSECSWATPERYRCGNELTKELGSVATQLVHQFSGGDPS